MAVEAMLGSSGVEDVSKPQISAQEIELFLADRFRVSGKLTMLDAERDQMYRVEREPGNSLVVRISPAAEAADALSLQEAALAAIAECDPSLPVPRQFKSVAQNTIEFLVQDCQRHPVRVFSYLDGVPVGRTEHSARQRQAIGKALARLDRALSTVNHVSDGHAFLWDLQRAVELRSLIASNPSANQRRLFNSIIDDFESGGLPKLRLLRRQLIHNDFNAKNVLVDPFDPDRVTGIIDFGDMVRSSLVADVAIAIARQVTRAHPIDEACDILSAYHLVLPLEATEIDMIHALICVRLSMRITIYAWRRTANEPRSQSVDLNETLELLDAFRSTGAERVSQRFKAACHLLN